MRGVTGQHSLFSRHRASSVERELARTPYAFTPKPREPNEPPDILNQRLIGPELTDDDPETLKRAREQILDPFEDDINVRLAKERLFGGYSRTGSRAPSPSIFPSTADFEKRLKKEEDHFENALFGPNVNLDTNSNFSEKLSDTSSIRTNNLDNDRLSDVFNFDNNLRVKQVNSRNDNSNLVKSRSNSGSDKSSILSDRSNLSAALPKGNRRIGDASSDASANPAKPFKAKQVAIQRNFGSDRSGSLEIIDTVDEAGKNDAKDKVGDVKKHVKVEEEPAFKFREFVHLKTDFDENVFLSRQDSLKVSRQGLEKYKKSRALAEGLTQRFYRNIYKDYGGSVDSGDTIVDEGTRKPFGEGDDLTSQFSQRIGREPLENAEAFKVLGIATAAAQSSIDLESISSTTSSFKVPPAVRAHRVSAFAILGETALAPPSESPVATLPPLPVAVLSSAPSGRVSPFRGKGFKPDPQSRHTTPRTSRANSPQRSRANSVTKAEVMAKVQARQTTSFDRSQTPLRDYIKENIEEVKELSEFNREKNEQLAEQKRVEEEIEIMKELGLIDNNIGNKYPKINLRSRSSSPVAILRFENISVPNSRIINSRDGLERLGRKPIVVKASPRSVPSSQPQSKSGSPQHSSKIPRRQTSMSPPRDDRDNNELPSIMSNALAADGRFISNSTSSINDSRVFSVIMDQENKPIDVSPLKGRSKSSSNLIPGPSILKSKPPKSPGKAGPPPTNRNLSAKRLSPIVSTPDKSPTPSKSSITGKSSISDSKSPLSSSRSPIPSSRSPISNDRNSIPNSKSHFSNSRGPISNSRISAQDKSKTKDSMSRETKRSDTRSKPHTPNAMSPSRIPKRPSKSLVTSPNASRAPSRAASRGPSRDISPNKKTSTGSKFNNLPKSSKAKSPSSMYRIEKNSVDSESNGSDKKIQLKRTNSRSSILSKKGPSGSKPELKRANSKTSLNKPLSRTNSIKSINEKSGTARRKSSMKDLQETIEESSSKGKSTGKNKPKRSGASKDDQPEDVLKQDNETQYDKQSQMDVSMDRLIPLTKNNVVSMTTAAITSQPLEIAAKVTSQLPATFEKAREKRELERISSSDSIAAAAKLAEASKIAEASKSSDADKNGETKGLDSAKLQKTASKTSLLSVKEDKEPMKRSDSIILHNNLKLKPIKTPLDPKVEKVKKKIDNILNSSQSSFEDIREKVKKADKVATDKANLEIEKATEKANQEIERATEKANQEIEKATEKANQEIEKATLKASEAVEKSVEKVEEVVKKANETAAIAHEKVATATSELNKNREQTKSDTHKKISEEVKSASKENEAGSILNGSKNVAEKSMTPVETVAKAEVLKPSGLTDDKPNPIELVKVKEDIIRKETLLPVVTVVNERPRGKMAESADDREHVTESVVRGDPDVEVQSGNMPMSGKVLDKKKDTTAKIGSLGDSHSTASGVANGASSNGAKLPESNGSLESDRDGKDMPSTGGAEKKGLCGKLWPPACCRSHNQSEVHLIDEKLNKKRKSEVSHGTVSSKKDDQVKKKGIWSRVCCCCCNNKDTDMKDAKMEEDKKTEVGADGAEKKKWCDRFICCRGKNKVSDSSVSVGEQPSLISGTGRPSITKKEPSSSLCCCCCRKKKDDWADRRDSILSQPQTNTSCWKKLSCCKKKDPSLDASRRTSMFSKKRSLSQAVPLEDKRFKLDPSLIEHTSMLRGAIPALPVPLAWLCLLCNFLIPGLGTVCSGLFCLCFGRPRFGVYDGWKPRIGAFLIDLIVGVGQLFTVLFCLVGWGWSIWWATIMIRVARKYKKFKVATPDPEQAQPTTNNHRAHDT